MESCSQAISEMILKPLWLETWKHSKHLDPKSLQNLLSLVALIPPDLSSFTPPSILQFCATLRKSSHSNHEVIPKAIKRALDFQWMEEDTEFIRAQLKIAVKDIMKNLELDSPNELKLSRHLTFILEELANPNRLQSRNHKIGQQIHPDWTNATIEWLMDEKKFFHQNLPELKSCYESVVEYIGIMIQLMVALTWSDGFKAISPECKQSDCFSTLSPFSIGKHCSRDGCKSKVAMKCYKHHYGFCKDCYKEEQLALIGIPGPKASTDIYDAVVTKVTKDLTTLKLEQVKSRNPPKRSVHWETTERLKDSSLVALVKQNRRGEPLVATSRIIWAQMVKYDSDRLEKYLVKEHKKEGRFSVALIELNHFHWKAGDALVIIDCKSFVPDRIPVLKALEIQKHAPLPFNNYTLLNIGISPPKFEGVVTEVTGGGPDKKQETANAPQLVPDSELVDDEETRFLLLVRNTLKRSVWEPIQQIRGNPELLTKLEKEISILLSKAKLDEGQLSAFMGALGYPVHCTHGPPGTGKSYLGELLIRTFIVVNDHWVLANPGEKKSPVLVLSYKNDSADEILHDLIKQGATSIMRIGRNGDEKLQAYSEFYLTNRKNLSLKSQAYKMKEVSLLIERCREEIDENIKLRVELFKEVPKQKSKFNDIITWVNKMIYRNFSQNESVDLKFVENFLVKKITLPFQYLPLLTVSLYYLPPHKIWNIIQHWLLGKRDPKCKVCPGLSLFKYEYCEDHICKFNSKGVECEKEVLPDKNYCKDHICPLRYCEEAKLPSPQKYCQDHSCRICIQFGLVAEAVEDHLTCPKHPLCNHLMKEDRCYNLAFENTPYCEEHLHSSDDIISQPSQLEKRPQQVRKENLSSDTKSTSLDSIERPKDVNSDVLNSEDVEEAVREDIEPELEEETAILEEIFEMDFDGQIGRDDESEDLGEEGKEGEVQPNQKCDCSKWSWEMPIDKRWEQIHVLKDLDLQKLKTVLKSLEDQLKDLQHRYHESKVQTKAELYQEKRIVGGTITGCIARLEEIRAARPFALVIEEASEVLEPLLVASFTNFTKKLELIGDHKQLRPLIDNYELATYKKLNISLFERLVTSKTVPTDVLSVQRRMRPNICNLIRPHYTDELKDHEVCFKRVLPESVPGRWNWASNGREVPGISPHLFFWSHSGRQTKSYVGLSQINIQEGNMVFHLVRYLLNCGVPMKSIAVLSPYSGQIKIIKDHLEQYQDVIISTVDKFQGNEADIIIISTVVDDNSKTPFLKEKNRIIVLLSRARIGMYILGNRSYFSKYNKDLLDELEKPSISDSVIETTFPFTGPRIGDKLPLCCPIHRKTTKLVGSTEPLKLGFCEEPCDHVLPCKHLCNIRCHVQGDHKSKCDVLLDSPCPQHPKKFNCDSVQSYKEALKRYVCKEIEMIQYPCLHTHPVECHMLKRLQSPADFPICNLLSDLPIQYPDCKHYLYCRCHQYKKYKDSPSSLTPCQEDVAYLPPCKHETKVKCYNKKAYEQGEPFNCCEKLNIKLPRCGHSATVYCHIAAKLKLWKGKSSKGGVVYEGGEYGPIDTRCDQITKFIRQCGHVEELPCKEAFHKASYPDKCVALKLMKNPECEHEVEVPCYEEREFEAFSFIKGNKLSVSCVKDVIILRDCGHKITVKCCDRNLLSPCEDVQICESPLCGHTIEVKCQLLKEFKIWKPWENKRHLGILGEDDPQPYVPQKYKHLVDNCNGTILVQRRCEHRQEILCSRAFSLFFSKNFGECPAKRTWTCPKFQHTMEYYCYKQKPTKCLGCNHLEINYFQEDMQQFFLRNFVKIPTPDVIKGLPKEHYKSIATTQTEREFLLSLAHWFNQFKKISSQNQLMWKPGCLDCFQFKTTKGFECTYTEGGFGLPIYLWNRSGIERFIRENRQREYTLVFMKCFVLNCVIGEVPSLPRNMNQKKEAIIKWTQKYTSQGINMSINEEGSKGVIFSRPVIHPMFEFTIPLSKMMKFEHNLEQFNPTQYLPKIIHGEMKTFLK